MFRKKKLIWWETEPSVGGAEQARARGAREEPGQRHRSKAPYYGPVTVSQDGDDIDDVFGLAAS